MRVFKSLSILILAIIVIYNNFSIGVINYSNNDIQVEVKGEVVNEGVYVLNKNSTFDDLLKIIELKENSDISSFSLQEPLYNKQVIVIGSNEIKKISINTATIEELCTLNGIGEKTALAILEYRKTHNGFRYLEELMNIKGIGEKKFEKIKEQISL